MKLKLYRVKDHYLNFLREKEPKIPMNKPSGKKRPFVGMVIKIDNIDYLSPLSSKKYSKQTDFKIKIANEQKSTIRFSYMFPIRKEAIIEINFTQEYEADPKYTALLINEYSYINQHRDKIYKIASRTYNNIINKKQNFEIFCCDFLMLEELSKKYIPL